MSVTRTLLLFVLAAVAEIGGAWLVWQGVREHRGALFIGAGMQRLGRFSEVEGPTGHVSTGFEHPHPSDDVVAIHPHVGGDIAPARE